MAKTQAEADIVQEWGLRIDRSKEERLRWDAWVATTMNFASGNQDIWWDKDARMRRKRIQKNEIFRIINLFPSSLGIISSRLTTNEPRWNPKAGQLESVTRDEIMAADAFLQNTYEESGDEDWSTRDTLKMIIRLAMLQGGCLVHIPFDDDTDLPRLDHFQLWDVFSDPTEQRLKGKKWLIIALPKSEEWIKRKFKKAEGKNIVLDNRFAESDRNEDYVRSQIGGGEGFDTSMVWFCYEAVGGKVEHTIIASDKVLKKEVFDHESLADIFDIYRPILSDRFYARPPCADWIEPQKSVNKTYSMIETYLDIFGVGRWRVDDESVSIPVGGLMGQIIEAAPGTLDNIPAEGLPSTHFLFLQQAIAQFEQISGVHGESFGRQSGSAESGTAISTLQAFDEQNSADSVDNYKTFMKRVAKKMLMRGEENWSQVKSVYRFDKRTGLEEEFKVIGERFKKERKNSVGGKVTQLRPFERVDVEITVGAWWHSTRKWEVVKDILGSGWTPGANPVIDHVVINAMVDVGDVREVTSDLQSMENPHAIRVTGQAALISEGEEISVDQNDPHEFYANFYEKKAQDALENGDQRSAQRLMAQAKEHNTIIGVEPEAGVGTAEAPAV